MKGLQIHTVTRRGHHLRGHRHHRGRRPIARRRRKTIRKRGYALYASRVIKP